MWYDYRCDGCGGVTELSEFSPIGECAVIQHCVGHGLRRVILPNSVQVHRPYDPYFNHAVGEVVTDDKHYHRILKRKSEEHSERVGTQIPLQPVYPADLRDSATELGVGQGADHGESIVHS